MKIEKVEKFAANLNDKTEYVIHIRNLKEALSHKLVLKKVHRTIKFKQKAWLKPYTDMNTDLRKAKNDFENISMFSHILHSFLKTALLVNIKKSYSKSIFAFYLRSMFISIYSFNQAFCLDLIILSTFLKTNP